MRGCAGCASYASWFAGRGWLDVNVDVPRNPDPLVGKVRVHKDCGCPRDIGWLECSLLLPYYYYYYLQCNYAIPRLEL